MTDAEFLQVVIKVSELRLNEQYQRAESRRRTVGAEAMANADPKSDDHGSIRLLIGTWGRIAIFAQAFSEAERKRFFRCTPLWLVWVALKPAVDIIMASGAVGPRYGKELGELAHVYHEWTQSDDGQEFRTEADQAVCANFS